MQLFFVVLDLAFNLYEIGNAVAGNEVDTYADLILGKKLLTCDVKRDKSGIYLVIRYRNSVFPKVIRTGFKNVNQLIVEVKSGFFKGKYVYRGVMGGVRKLEDVLRYALVNDGG